MIQETYTEVVFLFLDGRGMHTCAWSTTRTRRVKKEHTSLSRGGRLRGEGAVLEHDRKESIAISTRHVVSPWRFVTFALFTLIAVFLEGVSNRLCLCHCCCLDLLCTPYRFKSARCRCYDPVQPIRRWQKCTATALVVYVGVLSPVQPITHRK